MTVTINGTSREITASTVAQLIVELGFPTETVAVERNGAIVPRRTHDETLLAEGDRLEIVSFVGGG